MPKMAALLLTVIAAWPHPAAAEVFMWTGLVKGIYSFDSAHSVDGDHFTIEGFTRGK